MYWHGCGLCPLAIILWYALILVLIGLWVSPFFYCISKCTTFDIKPVYHFEDIGVLDLRVCYNGNGLLLNQFLIMR